MALDTSYRATIGRIAPVIPLLIEALQHGVTKADEYWTAEAFGRGRHPHLWPHIARAHTLERLADLGVPGFEDDDLPSPPMSAVLVKYGADILKVRLSHDGEVPVPGQSQALTEYFRQEPQIPGMETNNLLVLWRPEGGTLVEPLTLVRPLGGGRSRHDTIIEWSGTIESRMATLRAADLDELRPLFEQPALGSTDTA